MDMALMRAGPEGLMRWACGVVFVPLGLCKAACLAALVWPTFGRKDHPGYGQTAIEVPEPVGAHRATVSKVDVDCTGCGDPCLRHVVDEIHVSDMSWMSTCLMDVAPMRAGPEGLMRWACGRGLMHSYYY